MAKQQEYFSFRCAYGPEEIPDRLREQVKRLEDREYLVEVTEKGFDLGIGRGGHGAGYWYCAQVRRDGTGSRITGRVLHRHYTGRVSNDGELSIWDRLSIWVLTVALFPILFIPWLRQLIHPEPTMEEQFVEFMRSQMDCELME